MQESHYCHRCKSTKKFISVDVVFEEDKVMVKLRCEYCQKEIVSVMDMDEYLRSIGK